MHKEGLMGKIKSGYKPTLKIVLFLLIGCFAGSSLGKNGDEDLLRQAKKFLAHCHRLCCLKKILSLMR
jgi:hypothetical protein